MHPVLFHIGSVVVPTHGAVAAFGVLVALVFTQRTARILRIDAAKIWNLCILGLFAALASARLLLIVVNWSALRLHPSWLLSLAMIHHPLLAAAGALAGAACAAWYARRSKLPFRATADVLAAPLALGLAFEQLGALASGSGYGIDAAPGFRWAAIYTNPLAAIWSGAPLGVPLHPVQLYAALAFLAVAVLLYVWLPFEPQPGDTAGLCLLGMGVAIYITELWRDPSGRGAFLHGALDAPQIGAVLMVLTGALVLRERKTPPRQYVSASAAPDVPSVSASRASHERDSV